MGSQMNCLPINRDGILLCILILFVFIWHICPATCYRFHLQILVQVFPSPLLILFQLSGVCELDRVPSAETTFHIIAFPYLSRMHGCRYLNVDFNLCPFRLGVSRNTEKAKGNPPQRTPLHTEEEQFYSLLSTAITTLFITLLQYNSLLQTIE